MVDFPIDEAYLIGGWLASALWGSFTVLFCTSMYFIVTKRRSDLYKPTTWLMVIMYSLSTTHVFLALHRIVTALITLRDVPAGPVAYLADIGRPINRAKDLIYITNLVIGDAVVVWRCYAIWSGIQAVVVIPMIMTVGTAVAGCGSIRQYFLTNPSLSVAVAWGSSMFIISFCTNVVVTALSAGRIWYITRKQTSVFGSADRRYRTIILLVIESGAIIAFAKLIEFTLFEISPSGIDSGNNALYVLFDMMPQITGLMPTLIIAIVNAGFVSNTTYTTSAGLSTKPSAHGLKVFPGRGPSSTVLPSNSSSKNAVNSAGRRRSTESESLSSDVYGESRKGTMNVSRSQSQLAMPRAELVQLPDNHIHA